MIKKTSVAFIVARLSSSRLPGKQLRTIGDQTLLQWIINSLKQCHELDRIVLATVDEEVNTPLRHLAKEQDIDCFWFRGEVDHVTTRLRRAAEHFSADICVMISADCPLIDAHAIDSLIRSLKAHPHADYIVTPPDTQGRSCMLQGVLVATRTSWQRGDDLSDRPELKEHQFPVFRVRSDQFTPLLCHLDPTLYGAQHRLSIDTWSDLAFCNRLHDLLLQADKAFTLANVVHLLDRKPELKKMNQHVRQKQLIENTQRVLMFFVQAPSATLVSACTHLALQIIDQLGWPVSVLNAAQHAAHLAELGIQSIPEKQRGRAQHPGILGHFDLILLIADTDSALPELSLPASLPTLWLCEKQTTTVDHKQVHHFDPSTTSEAALAAVLNSLKTITGNKQA